MLKGVLGVLPFEINRINERTNRRRKACEFVQVHGWQLLLFLFVVVVAVFIYTSFMCLMP